MPCSGNCNLLKELLILEKNLFIKREKTSLELTDKEQWKLSEKQKGIEKKELLGELPERHYKKEQ